MREIAAEFQAKLDSGTTTLCRCWRIIRKDSVALGFTDHDEDLAFEGVTFQANSGLDSGTIQTSTGLAVDNSSVRGALNADGLTESDIIAGRYDGAEMWQWLVDWSDVAHRIVLFRGFLGEIRRGPTAFEAEVRGLAEALNKPLGRVYLRDCDAALGDSHCMIDVSLPQYSVEVVVIGADRNSAVFPELSEYSTGWFAQGTVRWLSGANAGLASAIKADISCDGKRVISLWREVAFSIEAGDRALLVAGCDKRQETCKGKFSNFANFRGFPHMPGEDWVVSYPKHGDRLDGGSMFREQ